jgi:primosomal protein N' (replication factor Y)
VALTFHQEMKRLVCHYCGFALLPALQCEKCKKPLSFTGFGTERVESEIARMFPKAKIERLDRDTVRERGSLEAVLDKFRKGEIDILIGTQMLSKGLDVKHLTLVGVLSCDGNLQLPDFRAHERTYQLLEQVSGRSGRGLVTGEVVLQTYLPDHFCIRAVVERKAEKYREEELAHRRTWQYPPFFQLMNLTLRGRVEKNVIQAAEDLKSTLNGLVAEQREAVQILGPASLPFYRLRGYYRWHLMVKGENLSLFKERFRAWLETRKPFSSVYVEIDVDPIQIL